MAVGMWGMLVKNNLVKKLIGMSIFQSAVILFFVAGASKHGATVPILEETLGLEDASLYANPLPHTLMLTAILGAAGAAALSLAGLWRVLSSGSISYHLGGWPPPEGIELVLDPLAGFMAVVVSFIGLIAIIYSRRSLLAEIPGKFSAFYGTSLLLLTGLLGIVLTGDLFNLYVFLEIASLSAYALIAIGSKQAPFSAFRYVIMGTLGGTFYLLGVGFLYFSTGTLNMADMANLLPALV